MEKAISGSVLRSSTTRTDRHYYVDELGTCVLNSITTIYTRPSLVEDGLYMYEYRYAPE